MTKPTPRLLARAMAMALAMVVMVPTSALGHVLYACTMTGNVGSKCCCQHDQEVSTTEAPSLTAAPCCEVFSVDAQLQATRAELVSAELEGPHVLGLSHDHDPSLRAPLHSGTDRAIHGARAPPSTGPPLFIKHCAYLI